MPAERPESDFLRAFRLAFEERNRAWNAGDVRGAYAGFPDELEYRLSPGWPEARVLRGWDDVIAFFEGFQETFPDARTELREFIEADEGTVVVGSQVTGSGRSSGAGTEMEIWQVWELGEELTPTSVREFGSRREALEEVGAHERIEGGAR